MQLNIEQKRIINNKPAGNILIKGVAGSGKTTVSVHRIPFLLNHYCFEEDDSILMLTYNKTLAKYIKFQYEKVESDEDFNFLSIFSGEEKRVQIATVDSLIFEYFRKYCKENKLKIELKMDSKLRYLIMQQSIELLKKEYPSVKILDQKFSSFLLDEIDWIKSCNYMEVEEYQNADRLGRTNKNSTDGGPQKLLKNSDVRKAIFELMQLYTEKYNANGIVDMKDAAIMALGQVRKKADKKYTHIIVDESQDLTKVQIEFISCLYQQKEYSSIAFVCDTAQSIYLHSWLVKGRSFTSIGFDMTGKSSTLSKNYRTTTQISQAAYSLIQNDSSILEDENFVAPSLIDRQGPAPIYKSYKNLHDECKFIAEEILDRLIENYELKDVVIIAKKKQQLNAINEMMKKFEVPSMLVDINDLDFEHQSVKLLTMHSVKGLEFKVVFIAGLNEKDIPYVSYSEDEDKQIQVTSDRKLLYVGMTRANELLYMSSSEKPSMFIGEIDPVLLRVSTRNQFRSFKNIHVEEYRMKEKIHNIYSNEEKVRQWITNELITTYKYPAKLIDFEHQVNQFSKVGFVDVAVLIYGSKGVKHPFIFIETKPYGSVLESGVAQIKSYMSSDKNCCYGIITNGNEIVIVDANFNEIDDIPKFNSAMLLSNFEKFEYKDFRHNKKFSIERDLASKTDIEISGVGERVTFQEKDLREIKIYGNIAAGNPVFMNNCIEDSFYVPKEWHSINEELFMLKIRGDSMIGAGIMEGDYVVIRQQTVANSRDIVAVSLEDDATLKRYVTMGDTVLLMPENEKYEPIPIKNEQVRILGVACGLVRKLDE